MDTGHIVLASVIIVIIGLWAAGWNTNLALRAMFVAIWSGAIYMAVFDIPFWRDRPFGDGYDFITLTYLFAVSYGAIAKGWADAKEQEKNRER